MDAVKGELIAIWIKRAHAGVMDPVPSATLLAEQGIVGNANQGGRRQVTLIEEEVWQKINRELDADIPPTARRANLLVRGVPLVETRGRILQIGSCRLQINGNTRPCELMDEMFQGLRAALMPDWGGGAYAAILNDGMIQVGDPVSWVE